MTELALDLEDQGGFVQKKSLKDEVFELLHRRIVAGKFASGAWLRQEDIASQLNVSQTPVREALDLLVSVGLAERVPYRGVRVPSLTQQEILDAYATRIILEPAIARLTATRINQEQLTTLTKLVERTKSLQTLDDMSNLRQLNHQFHHSIAQACGNILLIQLYDLTSNRFPDWMLYEYMFRHPELLPVSLEKEYREHHLILDALVSRDASRAANRITEHLSGLGRELVDYLGIPIELLESIDQ
jgi:DNA-binding GntR family transcriptional regulator